MPTITLLAAAAGAVLGWLLAHFWGRASAAETRGRLSVREEEAASLRSRIEQMNRRVDELQQAVRDEGERRAAAESLAARAAEFEEESGKLRRELSLLAAEHGKLKEAARLEKAALEEQLAFIAEARAKLEDTFKALSSEALQASNRSFLDLAKSRLETLQADARGDMDKRQKAVESLVAPIRETLDKYRQMLGEISEKQAGHYTSLMDQVKALIDSEKSLRDETGKLATALSAPQVRGRWGEITLRRVAELAGMVEYCDFYEQESTADTEKGRLRPDMTVRLPNNRVVVVDAKAPLKAYLEALECGTPHDRKAKLEKFAGHVRDRVNELSRKEYWEQFKEATPEFAVLFMPGEQFLGAALQEDPSLMEDAFLCKVVVATPATLIALLKAVAYGWRQEAMAKNARQISDLGKQLYERLSKMAEHFQDMGKHLDQSVSAFNRAMGTLETRVMVTARRFRELQATTADEIVTIEPVDQKSRLPAHEEQEGSDRETS